MVETINKFQLLISHKYTNTLSNMPQIQFVCMVETIWWKQVPSCLYRILRLSEVGLEMLTVESFPRVVISLPIYEYQQHPQILLQILLQMLLQVSTTYLSININTHYIYIYIKILYISYIYKYYYNSDSQFTNLWVSTAPT